MDASEMARALGKRGGKARAARLLPLERARIAALGGHSRALSLHAARRIAENFRFVESVDVFQPRPKIVRVRALTSRLPGIYAAKAQKP
jgi:hypothetical protein